MTVSVELLGVLAALLAVGVAVAGLALAGIRGLRTDLREQRAETLARMDAMEQKFNAQLRGLEPRFDTRLQSLEQTFNERLQGLEQKFDTRLKGLEQTFNERLQGLEQKFDTRLQSLDMRLQAVEHGQAKLEGLLEGLREAIVARGAA